LNTNNLNIQKMKNTILSAVIGVGILASFAFSNVISYSVNVEQSTVTWIGKKIAYSHNGTIKISEGKLDISEGNLIGGNFTIDMTSIEDLDLEDSEKNAKLLGHLKSPDFFGVEKYPTATMEITSVKMLKSEGGNYEVTGDLTIKGQTHPVVFPADISINDGIVTAKATIVFDRSKYDVRYGSGSFFDDLGDTVIYDDIEIGVELIANN